MIYEVTCFSAGKFVPNMKTGKRNRTGNRKDIGNILPNPIRIAAATQTMMKRLDCGMYFSTARHMIRDNRNQNE